MAHSRICSVQGCGKRHSGRGYCAVHYQRWHRYGDPNLGRDAKTQPNEAQTFFRTAVLTHDGDECLLWPFSRDTFGYAQLYWDGRVRRVHSILCAIKNGARPSPKHEAAHNCGKGHLGCVNQHHLRWDTRLGNQADRKRHGTHINGERHGSAVLTESQVREIRSLKGVEPLGDIAGRYGVSKQHISDIHLGKRWGWLE